MKTLWQKIQAVCSLLCICVYAAATVCAGLLIRDAVQEHAQLATKEYEELRDFAASAGVLGWTTASYKEDILDAITVKQTLEAVFIVGENYALAAEKTPGLITWAGEKPRLSGFYLLRRFAPAPLRIEGEKGITISGAASYIDFRNLLFILRKVLLAVLIAVFVSFALLIIDITLVKQPVDDEVDEDDGFEEAEDTEAAAPTLATVSSSSDSDAVEPEEPEAEESPLQSAPPPSPAAYEAAPAAAPEDDPLDGPERPIPPPDFAPAAQNEPEAAALPETDGIDTSDDFADFSAFTAGLDETGFAEGLYEHDPFGTLDEQPDFLRELEPALEYAEEAEQDMALLSAQWTEEGTSNEILEDAAAVCFKDGTRHFPRPPFGIYIIAPNTNIEEAFESAKQMHRQATAEQARGKKSRLLIGISSRAFRMVNPERLINETERALGKAGEDKRSPIVAFKVDPDKYSAFLAKQIEELV